MAYDLLASLSIELAIGMLSIYAAMRLGTSEKNFCIAALVETAQSCGLTNLRFDKWYRDFSIIFVISLILIFIFGPTDVTGPFLESVGFLMLLLAGLFLVYISMPGMQPRKTAIAVRPTIRQFVLALGFVFSMDIAWYIMFVYTLTFFTAAIKQVNEPYSGLYALLYYFSLIALSVGMVLLILSNAILALKVKILNTSFGRYGSTALQIKFENNGTFELDKIEKHGLRLKIHGEGRHRFVSWKTFHDIEVTGKNTSPPLKRK